MTLTKHQRICNDLHARIRRGDLRPGQALPSQQQLMSQYAVAQGTVRQALDRLAADGIVVAHRGKGTFVNDPRNTPRKAPATTLGLISVGPRETPAIDDMMLYSFQQACGGQSFEVAVRFFLDPNDQEIIPWASRHAGIAIRGMVDAALTARLQSHRIPVALVGELVDGPCPADVGWVQYDLRGYMSMAVQVLTATGHRRIWFVNREGSRYYRELGHLFSEYTAAAGVQSTSRTLVIPTRDGEAALVDELNAAAEKPTALLIEGDYRSCRFIHRLQQADWLVPQRVGVMSIGAADPSYLSVPDLSRVVMSIEQGMTRAVEVLAEQIHAGRVVRHVVPPQLAMGRTCPAVA